jgi:hypothetical protein
VAPVTSSLFVAVDPGGTTGVCTLRPDPLYGFDVSFREIPDRYEAEACVRDLVVGVGPATVIVERWDVRANTHQLTNQDDPRYIIGYVDGLCHQCRVVSGGVGARSGCGPAHVDVFGEGSWPCGC